MMVFFSIYYYGSTVCDIMTELNISNISTASETFTKPVQPVLKHVIWFEGVAD